MSKKDWITQAIEQHKRDTEKFPKWMLDAYAPKPPRKKREQLPKSK